MESPLVLIGIGLALISVRFFVRVWQWSRFRQAIQQAPGARRARWQDPVWNPETEQMERLYRDMLAAGGRWLSEVKGFSEAAADHECAVVAQQEYLRAAQIFRTALEARVENRMDSHDAVSWQAVH